MRKLYLASFSVSSSESGVKNIENHVRLVVVSEEDARTVVEILPEWKKSRLSSEGQVGIGEDEFRDAAYVKASQFIQNKFVSSNGKYELLNLTVESAIDSPIEKDLEYLPLAVVNWQ